MPTIIDSLVVVLGLDSSGLDKKSGPATKKLKDLEEQTSKQGKSFIKMNAAAKEGGIQLGVLATAVGSLFALIGGSEAIKRFTLSMIDSGAAVQRFASNLGLSAASVSAWGNVAEEFGGSASHIQGVLAKLNDAQTELKLTGTTAIAPYLGMIRVFPKAGETADRFMQRIMVGLSNLKDQALRTSIAKSIGFDDSEISVINRGAGAIDTLFAAQAKLAAEQAKWDAAAAPMQKSLVDLKQKMLLLGITILEKVTPVLSKLLDWLNRIATWSGQHKDAVATFAIAAGIALGALSVILGGLATAFTVASVAALALDVAASPIIAIMAGLVAPILIAVAAITAMGVAFVVLADHIDVVKKSFADLKAIAKDVLGAIYFDAKAAWALLHGDFKGAKANADMSDQYMRGLGSHIVHDAGKELAADGAPSGGDLSQGIARAEGFYAKGKTKNHPQRNHNPGNIEYKGGFAARHGAIGSDGRFAIFPDDSTGFAAMKALLASPAYAGLSDAAKLKKWAPASENDTASYARNAGIAAPIRMAGGGTTASSDNSTQGPNVAHVGIINVITQATDSAGIAKSIGSGMNFIFPQYANVGVS